MKILATVALVHVVLAGIVGVVTDDKNTHSIHLKSSPDNESRISKIVPTTPIPATPTPTPAPTIAVEENVSRITPKVIEEMGSLGWYGQIDKERDKEFQRNEQKVLVQIGQGYFKLTWCSSLDDDTMYKILYDWDRVSDHGTWMLYERKSGEYEEIQSGTWRLEEVVCKDEGKRRFLGWRRSRTGASLSPPIFMRLEFTEKPQGKAE